MNSIASYQNFKMVFIEEQLFFRIAVFLIVTIFSYVVLDKTGFIHRGLAIVISLIIGLFGMYYSTYEIDAWNFFFYSMGGFLILTGFVFLIFFFIVTSFPSSGLRRGMWALFGVMMYFMAQRLSTPLPDYAVILYIAVILVMILFDRWIMYLVERGKFNSLMKKRR